MLSTAVLPSPEIFDPPLEQELRMTFQVVLIGTDGLIIGSDRKMLTQAPYLAGSQAPFPQFEEQSKFIASEDESVICACSGAQEAQRIARQVVREIDPTLGLVEWMAALDSLSRQPQLSRSAQLVVVRKSCARQAVWLVAGASGYVSRIEEKQCVGDSTSACFLLGNFYKRCSVDELKSLALLTLDYGATDLPTSVGRNYDLLILREATDEVEWGRYEAGDGRVQELRRAFDRFAQSTIYGQ